MGDFIEFLYSRFLLSDGVSIDTRTIKEGNLFFALSGPNFNANQFAEEALEKGAAYVVVDDENYAKDERFIVAQDSLEALQQLAIFHRQRFKRPVIGITGSNGKTTTKELIYSVLSQKYQVHATKGNYNNHIGVPLTLLQIHPQIEIAIIEMGANHVGEIAQLCSMSQPDYGLITNIGHAHTETFGGIEGVIRGKSELFDYLIKNEGTALLNMDDPVISNMSKRFSNAVKYPGNDLKLIGSDPFIEIELNGEKATTQIIGAYNFQNIAAAVAVGETFSLSHQEILDGIKNYVPGNARSQVIKKGSTTIILDAYNANPDSMKAALENLARMKGNRVAILGDMNELEKPDESHTEILNFADDLGIEEIISVGEKMGRVAQKENHFDNKSALSKYLSEKDFSDSVVLLKASRSIKLETVLENIN